MFILEIISKKTIGRLLPIGFVIYLILLMGGNTNNPDTEIYNNIYYNSEFFSKDMGFGLLVRVFHECIGVQFDVFKLIVSILGIFLIHLTAKKYVKNISCFYILYFIYPFLMDVIQVRNFLAMSIFIYAVPWLTSNERKDIVKYVIAIAIAATIQKTALVYLPIIFIRKAYNKKHIKYILIILVVTSFFIGINKNVVAVFSNILLDNFADSLIGVSGFLEINTKYGWIIQWATQISNFALISWSRKLLANNRQLCDPSKKLLANSYEKTYKLIDIVYWINIYSFLFIPLYVVNINFYRIMRNIMPLNSMVYCISGKVILENKSENQKVVKLLYIVGVILYAFSMFYLNYIYKSEGKYWDIIQALFRDNWIFT